MDGVVVKRGAARKRKVTAAGIQSQNKETPAPGSGGRRYARRFFSGGSSITLLASCPPFRPDRDSRIPSAGRFPRLTKRLHSTFRVNPNSARR